MHRFFILFAFPALLASMPAKDIFTEKEIVLLQENREINHRVRIYMEAALLRLKSAEDRLNGKEPAEGDPLEFFTPEDLVQNYTRLLRNLMFHLDDVYQNPSREDNLGKALKSLKENTEKTARQLEILQKIAENQKKEKLWNLVKEAAELTGEAHKGAEYGLSEKSGF